MRGWIMSEVIIKEDDALIGDEKNAKLAKKGPENVETAEIKMSKCQNNKRYEEKKGKEKIYKHNEKLSVKKDTKKNVSLVDKYQKRLNNTHERI